MPQLDILTRIPTLGEMQAVNADVLAFWRFAGDALDETGDSHDLSITAGETFSIAHITEGIAGAAIGGNAERRAFDIITAAAELQVDDDFTMSCVFALQRAQNPANGEGLLILEMANSSEASTTAFTGAGLGGGLRYLFGVEDEGWLVAALSNGAGDAELFEFSQEARVVVGVPNHLVLRRSGTTLEVYINGALAGSATASVSTGNGTGDDVVVGRDMGGSRNFNGAIAGLCFWGTALSAADIGDVYDLHTVTVADSPFASRAAHSGAPLDFGNSPEYITEALSANRTYTLTNPVIGKVVTVEITASSAPFTIDASGGTVHALRTDTVTNGTMIFKIECADEDGPVYYTSLIDPS